MLGYCSFYVNKHGIDATCQFSIKFLKLLHLPFVCMSYFKWSVGTWRSKVFLIIFNLALAERILLKLLQWESHGRWLWKILGLGLFWIFARHLILLIMVWWFSWIDSVLRCFFSHLTDFPPHFSVFVKENIFFKTEQLSCGIPQGSILL